MPIWRVKRTCPSDCSSIMGDSPTFPNAVSHRRVNRRRRRDDVHDGGPIAGADSCHVCDDGPIVATISISWAALHTTCGS